MTSLDPFCRFPKDKFHGLDSTQDAVLILHQLGSQKLRRISLRENRPHIMAENISFELEDQQVSSDIHNPFRPAHGVLNLYYFWE